MAGIQVALCTFAAAVAIAHPVDAAVLRVDGTHFTVDGERTFLVGISYYGGLGAPKATVKRDLDAIRRHGFNWVRVWATWRYEDDDVSAVDRDGRPREPFLGRLKALAAECDRRRMVVDVTLSRDKTAQPGGIPDIAEHRTAVRTLTTALAGFRNWYLDLANERDVRDGRYVPVSEVRELRDLARKVAPALLVTASFGGHDLDDAYVREALVDARLDFVAPHRPRDASSPGQTELETRKCLAAMKRLGNIAPIHYQEPFRRGYTDWEPRAEDYATDLKGAIDGGAAGWCLHNGDTRGTRDGRPRRSFDLRDGPLFDQLDSEERLFVERDLCRIIVPSAKAGAATPR